MEARQGGLVGVIWALVAAVRSWRRRVPWDDARRRDVLAHRNRVTAVGEFAASLAHEMAQPIAAISANAETALRLLDDHHPDVAEVRAALAEIREDNQRAALLIRQIRAFMKQSAYEVSELDLNEVVRNVLLLVRHDAIQRGVEVQLELADERPWVIGDNIQLQQVILNLVANAMESVDGTTGERSIFIRTGFWSGAGAFVEVRDCGPGVSAEAMAHLFEPFFTTKKDGLGMGLAISRRIVEAGGGSIHLENSERGALFRVLLPLE